jgi:hypothetical protein
VAGQPPARAHRDRPDPEGLGDVDTPGRPRRPIPRTSEAQWSALPQVPLGAIQPGDLLFFNPGEFIAGLPGHVGIYIGNNEMVDAPHTDATVRVENLATWPTPFGAARPAALTTNGSTS